MAFTISRENSVFGNKRAVFISCSVDAASGNCDTGLTWIDAVAMCSISMATDGINVKKNLGANGTSIGGNLNICSATTGDSIFFIVYGR